MGRQNPLVGKHTYRLTLVDNETHEPIRSVRFGKAQGIYWIITAVLVLLTSWIGLAVYFLYAKDHLTEWFK